ncbi:MAG: urea carboxylase-associated family protein [Cytophagales bacterium]|nr:urea carboxylase-associated family protein [Armatimonadota bacterium]
MSRADENKGGSCRKVEHYHLPPQTGTAFRVRQGQILRVIDPLGEQVSDLIAFTDGSDGAEWLSSGRSIDYANTIYLTTGHTLYSNNSHAMFTIQEDRVGRHDFLLSPCSPETFQILYKQDRYHPSCFENLWRNLEPFGIAPHQIPTTLNLFMNVVVAPETGELTIGPPRSQAGDFIELRAEMDLIVGLTACSAEMSNNYSFKPIEAEIWETA